VQRPILRGLISLAAVAAALRAALGSARRRVFPARTARSRSPAARASARSVRTGRAGRRSSSSASDPSWSGDGTEIAYNGRDRNFGRERRRFVPASLSEATATQPTFSEDGNTVAFVKGGDLYTVLSNGTGGGGAAHEHRLDRSRSRGTRPTARRSLFASNVNGNYDIWIVASGGGVPFEVTSVAGDERNPSWSPNGATLVYSSAGGALHRRCRPDSTPADLNVPGPPPHTRLTASEDRVHHGRQPGRRERERHRDSDDRVEHGRRAADWQEAAPGSGPPRNLSYPTIKPAVGRLAARPRPFPHREHRHVGRRVLHHLHVTSGALRRSRSAEWNVRGHRRRHSSFYTPVNRRCRQAVCECR